ncbi:MAG: transcriptional regulator [Prevotellaceae bacterium]|nr:transcriptional regulator [Prevotellaceae bacterium]
MIATMTTDTPEMQSRMTGRMKNSRTARWYVLTLPSCHKGAPKGLQAELDRRNRDGEPAFEYFAPSYIEMRWENGALQRTSRPLLYNYVFVHSSEYELRRLKNSLPLYNFLPRVNDADGGHFPYLLDAEMRNLRWIAESYSNVLPVYTPQPGILVQGDRVRITSGRFKGAEANVVVSPASGSKEIMVCMEGWMWFPLLKVHPGEYEIIALAGSNKRLYTHLDDSRFTTGLHEALCNYYTTHTISPSDKELALEALRRYANLRLETEVMRCKLYAILLPAYTLLEKIEERQQLVGSIHAMLPLIKAEQSRALLLVALYGCTNNSIYHGMAHGLVDPWRREENPKKSKRQLIGWLDDYDHVLEHDRVPARC